MIFLGAHTLRMYVHLLYLACLPLGWSTTRDFSIPRFRIGFTKKSEILSLRRSVSPVTHIL